MRRKRTSQDSLELFLDTICNMFGGFVFIMLFVVVSIRSTADAKHEEMKASGIEPIADVEVETLELEAEKLRGELESLLDNKKNARELVENIIDPNVLEKYRETAEALEKLEETSETNRELAKQNEGSLERIEEIEAESERLKKELTKAKKSVADAKEEVLKARKRRVRSTSAPRMQTTYKAELPAILKFGRCYLWHEYGSSGELLDDVNHDLTLLDETKNGARRVMPKPWGGVDLDDPDAELALYEMFRPFSSAHYYVTIVVSPDSYAEYNVLSSFLKKRGFGIRPMASAPGEAIYDRGGYNDKAQ